MSQSSEALREATPRLPGGQSIKLIQAQSAGWIDTRGAQRGDQRRCGRGHNDDRRAHNVGQDAELRDDGDGAAEDLREPGGNHQTYADPQRCRLQRLAQDSRDDLTCRRTKRDADPELAGALHHQKRDDRIRAGECQQQPDDAEKRGGSGEGLKDPCEAGEE